MIQQFSMLPEWDDNYLHRKYLERRGPIVALGLHCNDLEFLGAIRLVASHYIRNSAN